MKRSFSLVTNDNVQQGECEIRWPLSQREVSLSKSSSVVSEGEERRERRELRDMEEVTHFLFATFEDTEKFGLAFKGIVDLFH